MIIVTYPLPNVKRCERKFDNMNNEEIRQGLINKAVVYSRSYHGGGLKYQAIEDVAHEQFHSIFPCGMERLFYEDYRERYFNYLIGDDEALTESEKEHIVNYLQYRDPPKYKYGESVFEHARIEIEEHRTEIKRLTETTEKLRKICDYAHPFQILDRISDYLSYYKKVAVREHNLVLAGIYQIGYIDGKRAERQRRKAHKQ